MIARPLHRWACVSTIVLKDSAIYLIHKKTMGLIDRSDGDTYFNSIFMSLCLGRGTFCAIMRGTNHSFRNSFSPRQFSSVNPLHLDNIWLLGYYEFCLGTGKRLLEQNCKLLSRRLSCGGNNVERANCIVHIVSSSFLHFREMTMLSFWLYFACEYLDRIFSKLFCFSLTLVIFSFV